MLDNKERIVIRWWFFSLFRWDQFGWRIGENDGIVESCCQGIDRHWRGKCCCPKNECQ